MPPVRTDPYPAFNFLFEISGMAKGSFSEVSGLDFSPPPSPSANASPASPHRSFSPLLPFISPMASSMPPSVTPYSNTPSFPSISTT
jgi:hypothetical protein